MSMPVNASPQPKCEEDESKQQGIEQERPVGFITAKQQQYDNLGKCQEQRSKSGAGLSEPVTLHSHAPRR